MKNCCHVSSMVNKVTQLIRAKKYKNKTIQKSKGRKDNEKKRIQHFKSSKASHFSLQVGMET